MSDSGENLDSNIDVLSGEVMELLKQRQAQKAQQKQNGNRKRERKIKQKENKDEDKSSNNSCEKYAQLMYERQKDLGLFKGNQKNNHMVEEQEQSTPPYQMPVVQELPNQQAYYDNLPEFNQRQTEGGGGLRPIPRNQQQMPCENDYQPVPSPPKAQNRRRGRNQEQNYQPYQQQEQRGPPRGNYEQPEQRGPPRGNYEQPEQRGPPRGNYDQPEQRGPPRGNYEQQEQRQPPRRDFDQSAGLREPEAQDREGNPTFDLGNERKKIRVSKYRGRVLIDLREYFKSPDNFESIPTKKGCSINIEQWEMLKQLIPSIDSQIDKVQGNQ